MRATNKHDNLPTALSAFALLAALLLTFSITVIKGGALEWVSLAWVSLCVLSLTVVLIWSLFTPSAFNKASDNQETDNHESDYQERDKASRFYLNIGKYWLRPAGIFVGFQLWVVIQHALLSQDKTSSFDYWLIGVGMCCLLAVWYVALKHHAALRALYASIIAFALIQSAYGLYVYLSDTDLLLWMPKLYYLDRPTGFFVNANHFAAYLVLAIILCVSRLVTREKPVHQRALLIQILDFLYTPQFFILVLLAGTLVATKSIGALASLGVVTAVFGIRFIWQTKHRSLILLSLLGVSFVALALILMLDYQQVEPLIADLSHTISRRIALSSAAFGMLQDHWLWGIGGGAFYSQFSPYRTLEIGNTYYNYAHNDLLQFWIEYGLIGAVLLTLFIGSVLKDNIKVLSRSKTGVAATFAYASLGSTLAVGLHSVVDFPLHIPGFSVCYLIVISVNSLLLINNAFNKPVATRKQPIQI